MTPEQFIERAKDIFADYGRDDYIFERGHETNARLEESARTCPGFPIVAFYEARYIDWYNEGWQKASQEKREIGSALFYLTKLLNRMNEGGEWYDNDFEKPMWLVKKAMEALREENSEPMVPPFTRELIEKLLEPYKIKDRL